MSALMLLPAPGTTTSLAMAASLIGCHPRTLKQRLHDPAYRYRYGWPEWDGYRWLFKADALLPHTRDSYRGGLPTTEPAVIVASLPSWCRRQATQ